MSFSFRDIRFALSASFYETLLCLSLQRHLWLYTLRQKHIARPTHTRMWHGEIYLNVSGQCLTTSYRRFICIGFFGFLFPPQFVLESSPKLNLMQTSHANLLHSRKQIQ